MLNSALQILLWSSLGSLAAPSGFWAPVIPPYAQYGIECSFDPVAAQLQGTETIRFRNTTTRAMERLALDWSLNPRKTVSATANGKPVVLLVPSGTKESAGPLLLQLPERLEPGADLELKVDFRNSYASEMDSKREFLLQSWHPRLWWGFGTMDDYEVRISAPAGWGVVTSGVLNEGSGIWKGKQMRDFAVQIFDEKQYTVERAQAGDVLVTAVHTAAGAKCARLVLETAVDVIGFYRQRFGFYPHRSLTIIPGMDYPAGGYPVATAMVAIHGEEQMEKKPEAHFQWITAHEIGHMYWSQYVLAEGEDELNWLMIGLGIHADREYRHARGIQPPVGNLPAGYVGGVKNGIDTTMDLSDEQEEIIDWDFNNIVEHGKSSAMMDALESTIGADAFDRAYRRSLREFHGRQMSWHDFEKVCEEESGEDLGWFFESWVRTNEFAMYQISGRESTRTDNGWRTRVEVASKGTRLERVPVVATFMDGSQQTLQTDRLAAESDLVFESKSPLKEVKIDPANSLWMLDSEPKLSAPDFERKVLRMNLTGSGEEALQLMPRAREIRLTNSPVWLHLGWMLYDARHYTESLECFQQALETTTDRDIQFLALAWQGLLLDLSERREAAVEAYKAAQANGSEQQFRHDQYELVIDQRWVKERLRTPFKRE
ncbi:MAG TPA: hypothetical protein VLZ50_15970 [Terracidiphilus sp.]|nr:hypothetical protein [Terracidiphilus sp.]